mmetsp:Transcript_34464/g.108196  ORF Transcript_34464/g.108196 Transcript_34464/m.108196 type:complete len:202 (-) Transcript_34464:122-727(-)
MLQVRRVRRLPRHGCAVPPRRRRRLLQAARPPPQDHPRQAQGELDHGRRVLRRGRHGPKVPPRTDSRRARGKGLAGRCLQYRAAAGQWIRPVTRPRHVQNRSTLRTRRRRPWAARPPGVRTRRESRAISDGESERRGGSTEAGPRPARARGCAAAANVRAQGGHSPGCEGTEAPAVPRAARVVPCGVSDARWCAAIEESRQ